ncbi:hypothetical protein A200_07699 [Parascardovia denticolens IPLA 20019]|nr:hypothetical protein A200_07699 [Parascardovia denticolens IPLA 20019]
MATATPVKTVHKPIADGNPCHRKPPATNKHTRETVAPMGERSAASLAITVAWNDGSSTMPHSFGFTSTSTGMRPAST